MSIERYTGTNQGGICPEIRTIAVSKVTSFPDVIEGRIIEEIEVDGEWETWDIEEETAHPIENPDNKAGRNSSTKELMFSVAKITYERQRLLETLEKEPQLIDYTDKNGTRKLIGTPSEGAIVRVLGLSSGKIAYDRNGFDLMIKCVRRHRVPYYAPPAPVPPPPPPPPVLLEIGDEHEGGIVGYILQEGDPGYDAEVQHGIIAAPTDFEGFVVFGCFGTAIGGTTAAIGAGAANTAAIMSGCGVAGSAAELCDSLVIGAFSDWHLPSYSELYQLYLNRVAIGGFSGGEYDVYISSTEGEFVPTNNSRGYGFGENIPYDISKNYSEWRCRAVRYF